MALIFSVYRMTKGICLAHKQPLGHEVKLSLY